MQQQLKFYNSLSGRKAELMAFDKKTTEDYLSALDRMQSMLGATSTPEGGTNINATPADSPAKPDGTR